MLKISNFVFDGSCVAAILRAAALSMSTGFNVRSRPRQILSADARTSSEARATRRIIYRLLVAVGSLLIGLGRRMRTVGRSLG